MAGNYASIGDLVCLYCEDSEGYLYSFRTSSQYNALSIFNKQDLNNPRNLPDPSIIQFEICIPNRFKLNKKYRKLYGDLDYQTVDSETRSHMKQAKTAADAENSDNRSEQSRNKGKRVRYGEVIQLRHVFGHRYIHVNTMQTSKKDKNNMMIGLLDYNEKSALFRIVPRYKVKSEGEFVQYLDQVSFESVKSPGHYFHASLPFQQDSINFGSELNLGVEQSSFTLIKARFCAEPDEEFIRGGQFVQLFHKELEAYVVAEGLFGEPVTENVHLRIREIDQLNPRTLRPSTSAITYWQIEDEKNSISAEPLLWQQQFRFRHVTTRQYLAINDEHQVTMVSDPSDPHTVFKLHPVPQETDEVTFDKNARIEHVITGSWLHALKDQEYKRQQFEKGQSKTLALRWDGGELRKLPTSEEALRLAKVAGATDKHYDDAYTVQRVMDEHVQTFRYVAGMVTILRSAEDAANKGMQMSPKDLQKLTQTLREIREFMIIDGKPEKDRQKLMRNLRIVDILVNIVKFMDESLNEIMLKFYKECYDVLYTYMRGNSRKNALYFAKYIQIFQAQLSNPTEIGLNVARMIIELIRDNRKIVDLINKEQISQIVERLRENQNYRYLELLEVLCVCNNTALPENQTYIADKWLLEDKRGVYITERGQNIHEEPNVLYVSGDTRKTWLPLHEFIDENHENYDHDKAWFLQKQLDLFKALGHGRNNYCIRVVTKELSYLSWEEAFLSLQSEILPDIIRAKYCELVIGLFIDIGGNFSVVDYPEKCFIYEYVGSKDKGASETHAGKDLVTIFPAVRDWITEFLDSNPFMNASLITHNMLIQQVLRLLQYLVKFGYYGDIVDVQNLLKPLINLLNGTQDVPFHLEKGKETKELRDKRKLVAKYQAGERFVPSPEARAIVDAKYAALEVVNLLLTFESNARLSTFVAKFKECQRMENDFKWLQSSSLVPALDPAFKSEEKSKGALRKLRAQQKELRTLFDATMYIDLDLLTSILLDLAHYQYDEMNQLALSTLNRLFSVREHCFDLAMGSLVLITTDSCCVHREVAKQIPMLRMMGQQMRVEDQFQKIVSMLEKFVAMTHLPGVPTEPHPLNQRIFMGNSVLGILFEFMASEVQPDMLDYDPKMKIIVRLVIQFMKGLALRYPEVQRECFEHFDSLLQLKSVETEVATMLRELFINNQDVCLKIVAKQLHRLVQLAAEFQEKVPEFLGLMSVIVKVEGPNLALKRNQTLVMKYIMQNFSKVAYPLEQPLEVREKVLMGQMGEDHQQYLFGLVDLLATCAEGENRYIESLCQTIMSMGDILKVLNNPDVDPHLKSPFLRFVINSYMRSTTDPADFLHNKDLWDFIDFMTQEIGFLMDYLDTASDSTLNFLLTNKFPKRLADHQVCTNCTQVMASDSNKPTSLVKEKPKFIIKEDEYKTHSAFHLIFDSFIPFIEVFSRVFYKKEWCETTQEPEIFDYIALTLVDFFEMLVPYMKDPDMLKQLIGCLTHLVRKSSHAPSVMEKVVEQIGTGQSVEDPIIQIRQGHKDYYRQEAALNSKLTRFSKNCKRIYGGHNTVQAQLRQGPADRPYNDEDAEDILPMSEEFQNLVKCFIIPSARETSEKYKLAELLVRQLSISAKANPHLQSATATNLRSRRVQEILDVRCLQVLRATIYNEERKLPEDWNLRSTEYRIKKGLQLIAEIQDTYDTFEVCQVILCHLANPCDDIVKEVLALQGMVLFNANRNVQASVLNYFLTSKEEVFFYAVRTRLQLSTASVKERRLLQNQKKARERDMEEQAKNLSTTMTLGVKALKEIQMIESRMKLEHAAAHLKGKGKGKGDSNQKKKEKKVAFNNPSLDTANDTTMKSKDYPDPTEVIVEEMEEEEEEKEEEEDPAMQVKDDGHIMLVLKVLARVCDGQHDGLQDYLRTQPDNIKTFNLVAEVTQFLENVYSNVSSDTIVLCSELFSTLNEFCAGNQENRMSIYDNKIIDYINFILRSADLSQCTIEEVVELWQSIANLIFSLIEENDPKSVELAKQIRETVDKEAVQRLMMEAYVMHESEKRVPEMYSPIDLDEVGKVRRGFRLRKDDQEDLRESLYEAGFTFFLILSRLRDLDKECGNTLKIFEDYERAHKFYSKSALKIEIVKGDYLHNLHFRVRNKNVLREEIKEKLKWGVDRSSPSNKIRDFMDWARSILIDIRRQRKIMANPIALPLSQGWLLWNHGVVIVSFIINILMLMGYQAPPKGAETDDFQPPANKSIALSPAFYKPAPEWQVEYVDLDMYVNVLGYAHNVLSLFMLLSFLIANSPKLPNFRYYWLRLRVILSNGDFEMDEEEFADMDAKMVTYLFSFKTYYYFVFLALSIAGHWHSHYWYAFHLLNIVNNNQLLQGVIQAVTQNGRSLVWVTILGVVIIYIYAIVAFAYFRSGFRTESFMYCDTLWHCFVTILRFGLLGDLFGGMVPHTAEASFVRYAMMVIYHVTFFIFISTIGLNIIFGIIVDTFSELRDLKWTAEADMKDTCFICSRNSYDFEHAGVGFDDHVNQEHNMWAYIFFFIRLLDTKSNDYTALDLHVSTQLKADRYDFFPLNRALCLSGKDDDSAEAKLDDLIASVEDLVRHQKKEETNRKRLEESLRQQRWQKQHGGQSSMDQLMVVPPGQKAADRPGDAAREPHSAASPMPSVSDDVDYELGGDASRRVSDHELSTSNLSGEEGYPPPAYPADDPLDFLDDYDERAPSPK